LEEYEHRFVKLAGFITMQDVARAARVSRSTVSKALRDDPSIPLRRRKAIKAVALRLDYRPHPMVSALMAHLHGQRRNQDPFYIAWIDLWTKEDSGAHTNRGAMLTLSHAQRRAKELGYNIEVYRAATDGLGPSRLRQILTARSQWAVICPPVPEPAMRYELDMAGLSGVTIGTSLREPRIHRVSHNHFGGARLACQKLREKGFRRIGFVLSPWNDERTDSKWRAAYLLEQEGYPPGERLPPLLVGSTGWKEFKRWFDLYQPDAILTSDAYVADWLRRVEAPPVRIGWLGLSVFKKGIWGVDYCYGGLGAAAVELLIGQVHRNERGTPSLPHSLLIDGKWVEC